MQKIHMYCVGACTKYSVVMLVHLSHYYLSRRKDSCPSMPRKLTPAEIRSKVVEEILNTEKDYVKHLEDIIEVRKDIVSYIGNYISEHTPIVHITNMHSLTGIFEEVQNQHKVI